MTLKVGDTLYRLESYRRSGDEKWIAYKIEGETKFSWLVGQFSPTIKVNKKTMRTAADFRGHCDKFFTEEGRDARDFCDKYARDIASSVSVCGDPEKLKKIAEIIGMEL